MNRRPDNAFLNSLPADSYEKLAVNLKSVDLALGARVSLQGGPVDWVYFPETCLLSMISASDAGESVETSMVGAEGAAGVLEAGGSGRSSVECVVQVDGRAWRTPAAHCRKLMASDAGFAAAAWNAVELQMAESRQSALCQAMHPVEARFARWLLESVDRSAGRNPLPLTQEFLAAMLGVQRTTVSAFAARLQREGLMTYSRGKLAVDDEAGMERKSCDCRRAVVAQRRRLGFPAPSAQA
ncbi:Crp/Fnr family transcriptional regulator [soil metagenome]